MNYWPVKSPLFSLSSAAQGYSVNSVAIVKKYIFKERFRNIIQSCYFITAFQWRLEFHRLVNPILFTSQDLPDLAIHVSEQLFEILICDLCENL